MSFFPDTSLSKCPASVGTDLRPLNLVFDAQALLDGLVSEKNACFKCLNLQYAIEDLL